MKQKASFLPSLAPWRIRLATTAFYAPLLLTPLVSLGAAEPVNPVSLQGGNISRDGFFQFFFSAQAGQTYPIGVSTDLLHWTLLTNATGGPGTLLIHDHEAPLLPRRYYHVGLPPALPTPITNMVFIAPVTFTMGSPLTEAGRETNEGPQTVVTLTRGFWIGKYEVKQIDYIYLMGSNISFFSYDSRLPLDFVTFAHATNYCYQLTQVERAAGHLPPGYSYRLPTEAEWEYACRAGTTTPFAIGNGSSLSSTQANFDGSFPYGGAAPGQSLRQTSIGGTFPPNAWGVCDMHGNVWEWCQDWYAPYPGGSVTDPKGPASGSTHVLRGGAYTSSGQACRSARRDFRSLTYANTIQGMRIVLAADP